MDIAAAARSPVALRPAARDASDAAARFLLARQHPDGSWRDFATLAGCAVDWPTAYCAVALAGRPEAAGAVDAAARSLTRNCQASGGWGYHDHVPEDCDSTAYALMLLAAAGRGALAAAGAERLAAHQHENGGFATYARGDAIRAFMGVGPEISLAGWCQAHNEVTAAAGRALLRAGLDEAAERAWTFLAGRQSLDGRWPSYWWTCDYYATWQAVAFARDLGTPAAEAAAGRARGWCAAGQAANGSWADGRSGRPSAFATALALLILGGRDPDAGGRGHGYLLARQRSDGGWDSHPMLRIPQPWVVEPDPTAAWEEDMLGTGVVIRDANACYTTATVLLALSQAV